MRTCLITGARGFCGRHLVSRLAEEGGFRVIGTGRCGEVPSDTGLDEYIPADVRDEGQMGKVVRDSRPDMVFHLAGIRHGTAEEMDRVNLIGSLTVLDTLKRYAPRARVLLVGTAAEYGAVEVNNLPVTEGHRCQPCGSYGTSKHAMALAGLDYGRGFGLSVVLARPFNIIGAGISRDLMLGAVLCRAKMALAGAGDPVVHVGNVQTERDFVAVEDVVDAYVRMLTGNFGGEIFNLCSGRPHSVRSLIALALAQSPRAIRAEVDPRLVRSSEVEIIYGSWAKAHRTFGFRPATSVESSVRAAWNYEMALPNLANTAGSW